MPVIEITSQLNCPLPTPVRFPMPPGFVATGALQLRAQGASQVLPVQRDGDDLVAILPSTKANEKRRYVLEKASAAPAGGVKLKEEGAHGLAIVMPDGLFTVYNLNPEGARPYFHPVVGPGGTPVTRNFPMKDLAEEKNAKDQDHPHHRSFWTAFDEVSGTDNWSELPRHGFTKHKEFAGRAEGPVFGGFTADATWTSKEGKPLLDERRTIRVYNVGPNLRLLDYDVQLKASYQDIEYGDTKEGGILAFRVFHTMKEKEGGNLYNSNGEVGEKEVWGKKAAWLDYVGPIQGKTYGIAMMDHPGNLNHPCRWHARNYGLVGTNPFSNASFEKGAPETIFKQPKGETLRFRYRVYIHRHDTKTADVDDVYHAWIQAPKATIL